MLKYTISNILIIISIIFTIIGYFDYSFIQTWSINNFYLEKWNYFHFIIQFFSWTFLHAWIIHLLFNSIFIFYFWNAVEIMIWKIKYLIFFVLFVFFNWIILAYLEPNNYTIWISGFAMAILTYYTLELKSKNNPEYKWWITAIILNLWFWLMPQISFYWHLNWVIYWIIFYYLNNDFFKRQLIWLFRYLRWTQTIKSITPINIKKD